MGERRPRVFVSSTVFDLGDLRSSLRWWLSEMGYDAQLSEHSAFDKPLSTDSYTACLQAVEDNDYFILVIGNRRGGLVNETAKISITRAEYRRAYELFAKAKRPQIITFVRASVWAAYEDRRGISKVLNSDELKAIIPDDVRAKIKNAPSEVVEHPEHTFAFIDEVKRLDEIIAARKQGAPWPAGNWVHVFSDFGDIANVLRSQFRVGPLRQAASGATLKAELQSIAYPLVVPQREVDVLVPMKEYIAPHRLALTAPPITEDVRLPGTALAALAIFMLISSRPGIVTFASAVDAAIASGEFLVWDEQTHRYTLGPIHVALIQLRQEIHLLERNESGRQPAWSGLLNGWHVRSKAQDPSTWDDVVPNMLRMTAAALHDRHSNILDLCAALRLAVDGDSSALDKLYLWSPSVNTARQRPFPNDGAQLRKLDACLSGVAKRITSAQHPAEQPTDDDE